MSESQIGVWRINVAGYGEFEYVGTKVDAEEMRRHKSNWERGVGRKERLRDANLEEADRYHRRGPFSADKPESP